MLYRNAAAQRFHAIDIALADGFGVIEEPVQTIERNITVHFLEHIQHPADGLIVSGMQTEWPAVFHQMAHYALQLILHPFRQIRARLQEIFEVRGGEDQHLTGTVRTIEIGSLARLEHIGPAFEIVQFLLRSLSKQVIGNTHRHLVISMQLLDDLVIFRVVLKTTACVNGAGQPETIQFAHKLAGGVHLHLQR